MALHVPRPARLRPTPRRAAVLAFGACLLAAACGGGGGGGGFGGLPGSGGTGFASGPISGLGSIIVNGVRYDDRTATLVDDEGRQVPRGSGADDPLQVGVVVDVTGPIDPATLSGRAESLSFHSELRGRVDAVNAATGQLTVLGRTVKLKTTTVYTGLTGLADLAVDQVVEVYGLSDDSGALVATRVEREALSVAAFGGDFRLRGTVSQLAGNRPTQSLTVGGLPMVTDGGSEVDASLSLGARVSVRFDKTPVGGVYRVRVLRVKSLGFLSPTLQRAEVEGFITRFTSLGSFEVNGYPVRTGTATVFEDGTAGVVLGARVEVQGSVSAGVMDAAKVEIKKRDDNDEDNDDEQDDGGSDGRDAPFEFDGTAGTVTPVDAQNGRFTVRGELIRYDAGTRFADNLTPGTLAGVRVEVDAFADGQENGRTRYRATRIERDD